MSSRSDPSSPKRLQAIRTATTPASKPTYGAAANGFACNTVTTNAQAARAPAGNTIARSLLVSRVTPGVTISAAPISAATATCAHR